jgi:hypothetical protein
MSTPRTHVLLLELLLPLTIERWNIKFFVPLPIASLDYLLHLKDINFECRVKSWHGYHPTQGNNHLNFVPQHHLVLVKNFIIVELGLVMNGLNSPIKRQGVCIWHHLGSLEKKLECYKCTMNYMKEIHNLQTKGYPMHPIPRVSP